MPDGEPRLRVLVADERGRAVAAPGLAAWLRRVAPARARGVVSVALVSDQRVRALNRTYRRKDYATDVLSFPNASSPSNPQSLIPNPFLGDIVIARGVARRQARAGARTASRPSCECSRSTACCTCLATITSATTAGCGAWSAVCAARAASTKA